MAAGKLRSLFAAVHTTAAGASLLTPYPFQEAAITRLLMPGRRGLLLADRADVRTSFAFAPMRLRERDGRQVVSLNPFGSYHGRQLAYDHLGGNGVGTAFTTLGSSALRPSAPSYNGEAERFSLLLAPYLGDAPPARLRAEAELRLEADGAPAITRARHRGALEACVQALERAEAFRLAGDL